MKFEVTRVASDAFTISPVGGGVMSGLEIMLHESMDIEATAKRIAEFLSEDDPFRDAWPERVERLKAALREIIELDGDAWHTSRKIARNALDLEGTAGGEK